MGETMTLLEITRNLDCLDAGATIYARAPWAPTSEAVVTRELESGRSSPEASSQSMEYFLEVFIARDFLADWTATLQRRPIEIEQCERLIEYATHDA